MISSFEGLINVGKRDTIFKSTLAHKVTRWIYLKRIKFRGFRGY